MTTHLAAAVLLTLFSTQSAATPGAQAADTARVRAALDVVTALRDDIEGSHGRFVTVNGIKMHYLEWGEQNAVPLVWAHGSASAAYEIRHVALRLAQAGYRVLAVDYRGHAMGCRQRQCQARAQYFTSPEPSEAACAFALWRQMAKRVRPRRGETFVSRSEPRVRVGRCVVDVYGNRPAKYNSLWVRLQPDRSGGVHISLGRGASIRRFEATVTCDRPRQIGPAEKPDPTSVGCTFRRINGY